MNNLSALLAHNSLILALTILSQQCNRHANQLENCNANYKKARLDFNTYYTHNDTVYLQKAIADVQLATKCDETRRSAIELKLSALSLLKQYEHGYKYVDSLQMDDFRISYKKIMWHNYFLAQDYESKSDTVNRNKNYNEIIKTIENLIQQENLEKSKIDEEAYADLFSIKARIMDKEKIHSELDVLAKRYPEKKEFFEDLKNTTSYGRAESSADPVPQ